ncbi:phosphoribosylamine--glycine ligase [Lacticaseibacillus saniviri]
MTQHVLIIGRGGREAALGIKFRDAPSVDRVYVAPGNPGMALLGLTSVPIAENDFDGLIAFAKDHVELTVVGPEAPLVGGIVDVFEAAGLAIFGVNQQLAQLEASKQFAKAFMARHQLPTAAAVVVRSLREAQTQLQQWQAPIVIKRDGLAGGKGVFVCQTMTQAQDRLHQLYAEDSAMPLVLEEYLVGQEASVMAFFADDRLVILPLSQDYKRRFSGDAGPNTGGMGAISPAPQFTSEEQAAAKHLMQATVTGMMTDGMRGCGVIYMGLIFTADGPKILEYNMRLGDPETQVLLPQIQEDLYTVLTTLMAGETPRITLNGRYYLTLVMVHPQYPGATDRAVRVKIPEPKDLTSDIWLPAAVDVDEAHLLTSAGGRVVDVVGCGATLRDAQLVAEQLADQYAGELAYRRDIGYHALNMEHA